MVLHASVGLPVQRVQFSALGIFPGLRWEAGSVTAKLSIAISCCVKVPRPRDKIVMIAPILARYLDNQLLLEGHKGKLPTAFSRSTEIPNYPKPPARRHP